MAVVDFCLFSTDSLANLHYIKKTQTDSFLSVTQSKLNQGCVKMVHKQHSTKETVFVIMLAVVITSLSRLEVCVAVFFFFF